MWLGLGLLLLACACTFCGSAPDCLGETFTEELLLRPQADRAVIAHVHFESQAPAGSSHTHFPRVIDQLAASTNVSELHLSLTQGRWHAERWGRPPLPAPLAGAQLRAAFVPMMSAEGNRFRWNALAHGLSGLFCSSLNFLDTDQHVTQPTMTFSSAAGAGSQRTAWTSGALPREAVCTENLTPWLRLLPCREATGIAALLHGPTVFASPFTSLTATLVVKPDGKGCGNRLKLMQTLTLVLPARRSGKWTLDSLFAVSAVRACPLASLSAVHIQLPQPPGPVEQEVLASETISAGSRQQLADALGVSPSPGSIQTNGDGLLLQYYLPHGAAMPPLQLRHHPKELALQAHSVQDRPAMSVLRHVFGRGEEQGTLMLHVGMAAASDVNMTTSDAASSVQQELCIFQMVPWWVQIWLHTLQLDYDGQAVSLAEVVTSRRIMPAEDRGAPVQLELCLAVGQAVRFVKLQIVFQKAFLTVFEHPPDASRGLDLPAAIVTLLPDGAERTSRTKTTAARPLFRHMNIHHREQAASEGALVQLAQPDFSMPYNVCCLTSTVLAVYLGALLNTLLKRQAPYQTPAQLATANRRRKFRVAAVLLMFGSAAVYMDKDLRRNIVWQLEALGLLSNS